MGCGRPRIQKNHGQCHPPYIEKQPPENDDLINIHIHIFETMPRCQDAKMPREEEMIFTPQKKQLIDEHDEHVHNDNVLDHGNSLAASDEKITPPNGLMGKPRYLSG